MPGYRPYNSPHLAAGVWWCVWGRPGVGQGRFYPHPASWSAKVSEACLTFLSFFSSDLFSCLFFRPFPNYAFFLLTYPSILPFLFSLSSETRTEESVAGRENNGGERKRVKRILAGIRKRRYRVCSLFFYLCLFCLSRHPPRHMQNLN